MDKKKRAVQLPDSEVIKEKIGSNDEDIAKLNFALKLIEIMKTREISQKELATDIDVSGSMLSSYIHGKSDANISTLYRTADKYNLSADFLLGLSETKSRDPKKQDAINYTRLSEGAVDAITDIGVKGSSPQYLEILNMLFEEGFMTKLVKAFWRFTVRDNADEIWLKDDSYPDNLPERLDVWILKHELDDSVDAVIDAVKSKHSKSK